MSKTTVARHSRAIDRGHDRAYVRDDLDDAARVEVLLALAKGK